MPNFGQQIANAIKNRVKQPTPRVADSTPETTFKVPAKKTGTILEKGKRVPYDGNVNKRTQNDLKSL